MKVKIYRYKERQNEYITAKALTDIPADLQKKFGGVVLFKELDIDLSDAPRIAIDTRAVIADINKQGYHVSGAEIKFGTKG